MAAKPDRDVDRGYSKAQFIAKLRRLADALEQGRTFDIQVAGERVRVPPHATVEFEYQREGDEEELEIELKWTRR